LSALEQQEGPLIEADADVVAEPAREIAALRAHSEMPLRVSYGDVDRGWPSPVAEVTSALLAAVR
jgi:hypothetical protein